MTGEEMERAIEFLLKNQADFDARLNRLTEEVGHLAEEVGHLTGEVGETSQQLRFYAETQTEFIKVVTQHIEAQAQINDEFRATRKRIAEDLHALATTVQRFVEGRDRSG
jgi:methyl-accepting chemotaxis protein